MRGVKASNWRKLRKTWETPLDRFLKKSVCLRSFFFTPNVLTLFLVPNQKKTESRKKSGWFHSVNPRIFFFVFIRHVRHVNRGLMKNNGLWQWGAKRHGRSWVGSRGQLGKFLSSVSQRFLLPWTRKKISKSLLTSVVAKLFVFFTSMTQSPHKAFLELSWRFHKIDWRQPSRI